LTDRSEDSEAERKQKIEDALKKAAEARLKANELQSKALEAQKQAADQEKAAFEADQEASKAAGLPLDAKDPAVQARQRAADSQEAAFYAQRKATQDETEADVAEQRSLHELSPRTKTITNSRRNFLVVMAIVIIVLGGGLSSIALSQQATIRSLQSQIKQSTGSQPATETTTTASASTVTSSLPSSNPWTPTPPMNVNRSFSAVATLQNGSVLVAGGFAGAVANSSISSAEMYNPSTNTWKMVAPMHVGRAGAIAVTLKNGEVLVSGGLGSTGPLTSCELYNPTTNTWTMTGNMTQARYDHQMVMLNNGSVLVIGGDFGGTENNVTEVYNPATGNWTTVAPQPQARADMVVVVLPDGNVLVAGGHTAFAPTLLSEIYDPTTNTWSHTGNLNTPHGDAGGVLLNDGDVLIAGGYSTYNDTDNTIQYLYLSELFNTTTNTWKMTGDMNFPRGEIGLSTVKLDNGEVLVPGGNYQPETGQTTAELYNPVTGTWSMAGTMSVPRGSGAMAVLLDSGKVLAFGGLLPHSCEFCGNGTTGQDLATSSADLFNPNATTTTSTSTTITAKAALGVPVMIPTGAGTPAGAPGFAPDSITVVIGVNNTVTWTNGDTVPHTVTSKTVPSGASSFNSGNLAPGAVFTYAFTVPGTYTYYCEYHNWMQGTVTVISK
jgi:plastocyanin/N-acetylneuraminic acid mutarotase